MVKKVGVYTVGRLLGEGTFGKVKVGENTKTGERVAIKIMDKAKLVKQGMASQVRREISIMRMISHPNIVNLLDVLASKTKIYLVSELAIGGELFYKLASEGRFSEETARFYFHQLIKGIHYCHSQGVCHRDLKPENLLLTEDNKVLKISDFGLGTLMRDDEGESSKLLRTQCGTPNYVSPEVLSGQPYDGAAADVWSTGVVLFVFLAGYLPFEEQSTSVLFKKIQTATFQFPPWMSAGAKNLISKILVVDPRRRITIEGIMKDEWFQVEYEQGPPSEVLDTTRALDPAFTDVEEEDEKEVESFLYTGIPRANAFELISVALDFGRIAAVPSHPASGIAQAALITSRLPTGQNVSRFFSRETPKVLMETITKILATMSVVCKVEEAVFKIKAVAQGQSGLVGFHVQLYLVTEDPPLYLIEFTKTMGDTLEFNKLRTTVFDRCSVIVANQQREART